ncbi:MAG: trypsin-like peptidase domain-containing protein [Acidobacteria bacterium]|nr:trypsin-like peptidase domain-containing protein [Acidobacteriota bacterium]
MNRFVTLALLIASLIIGVTVEAGKPLPSPEENVVGHGQDLVIVPDLGDGVRMGAELVWSDLIHIKDATFLKAHIVDLNLREGDTLVLRSQSGRVVEILTGRGPNGLGSFWALSAFGEMLHLELHLSHDYNQPPFRIDQVIVGDVDLFGSGDDQSESICAPADFEDVVCYDGDAEKWATVMASVGVMSVGSNPTTGLWCSGSNVSPNNYVMTNWHCVPDASPCTNTEFVFKYYNTTCGGGTTTPDWESFHCDQTVAESPFGSCDAGLSDLDFTLNSVIGDPASTYGWVTPDPNVLTDGEAIYIVQHPDGRPHEITHGSGANVDVDGTVLRYYDTLDTEGGSSGSPIYRESDNKMVGLHHCGGCDTPGTGNRGMLMGDIYPLIQEFLCTAEVEIVSASLEGMAEVEGNGNTIVEPGETWQFTPRVTNTSCATEATGVAADLQSGAGSAGISLAGANADFGTVAAGTTAPSVTPVEFTVEPSAACGETVLIDMLNLRATGVGPFPGANGYLTRTLGEVVFTTLFLEDFPGGITGDWTIVDGGSSTGGVHTWTDTNPGGRSLPLTEPFAIMDSDEAGSGQTQDEELISPMIDVTGFATVTLQFSHDFNWYSGSTDEQADVDVRSAATGGSWVTVANYSGVDTSGTVTVDVTAYAAADLQLRFHYYDASFDYWWAVDDIYLLGDNGFVCEPFGAIFSDGFESGDTTLWTRFSP